MIYEYKCPKCENIFNVVKPSDLHRSPETCSCGEPAKRVFGSPTLNIDRTQTEYYHSLGTWVKSRAHRKELMKERGLVELGSEKPETVRREAKAIMDAKRKKRYDDAMRV